MTQHQAAPSDAPGPFDPLRLPLHRAPSARIAVGALVVVPLPLVAVWWLIIWAAGWSGPPAVEYVTAIGLLLVGAGALIAYGRRHRIDPFGIGAAVLTLIPATGAWFFGSFFLLIAVTCSEDCLS